MRAKRWEDWPQTIRLLCEYRLVSQFEKLVIKLHCSFAESVDGATAGALFIR